MVKSKMERVHSPRERYLALKTGPKDETETSTNISVDKSPENALGRLLELKKVFFVFLKGYARYSKAN